MGLCKEIKNESCRTVLYFCPCSFWSLEYSSIFWAGCWMGLPLDIAAVAVRSLLGVTLQGVCAFGKGVFVCGQLGREILPKSARRLPRQHLTDLVFRLFLFLALIFTDVSFFTDIRELGLSGKSSTYYYLFKEVLSGTCINFPC